MSRSRLDRRTFLGTSVLAGAGTLAGVLLPGRAGAFRIEEDAAAEQIYLSACETRATHDALVKALIAELEGQEGRERALEIVRSMSCPTCGCKLAQVMEPNAGASGS